MTHIDRPTAVAFANAIARIRPDWDVPGIRAEFERVSHGSDAEALAAFAKGAQNGARNTPRGLADPGNHWATASVLSTPAGPVLANWDFCPEHPGIPRKDCMADSNRHPTAEAESIAAIRAAYGVQTGSRPAPPEQRRNRVTPAQTKHLDSARTRADRWNR